ncbi:MAG: hypothetical protein ACR2I8_06725, partial [Steroidobacteraceae bacterium]
AWSAAWVHLSALHLAANSAGALLVVALGVGAARSGATSAAGVARPSFLIQPFSVEFLHEYWLHFELTSVLLVAAVVAAIAVIRSTRRLDD